MERGGVALGPAAPRGPRGPGGGCRLDLWEPRTSHVARESQLGSLAGTGEANLLGLEAGGQQSPSCFLGSHVIVKL